MGRKSVCLKKAQSLDEQVPFAPSKLGMISRFHHAIRIEQGILSPARLTEHILSTIRQDTVEEYL